MIKTYFPQYYRRVRAMATLAFGTLALALVAPSCQQEDDLSPRIEQEAETEQRFELLSVRSYERGNTVELDANLLFEDNLRAISFSEDDATGELVQPLLGQTEQMHIFVRKLGDDASLAMATLTWKGRTGNKLVLEKIKIALPAGYDVGAGEQWFVSGILGGKLDEAGKRVRLGEGEEGGIKSRKSVDMPFSFGWKPLTIVETNKATLGTTTLAPRGALLRLHFYSDLLEGYELRGLRLSSNALRTAGVFSPLSVDNNATQAGGQAAWTADAAAGVASVATDIDLSRVPISLASGAGHASERTLFVWVMPSVVEAEASRTDIDLMLRLQGSSEEARPMRSYSRTGHRALVEGMSYRMSNVLTAPLMISEVYYQFAPSTTQVYSIAEIYNPTASDIDLTDYALVRIGERNNTYGYATVGNSHPDQPAAQVLRNAGFLPLGAVGGTTAHNGKFPSTPGIHYGHSWHKPIYGEPSLILKAGKTILIGGGGYVATDHKPGKNIELFNESGYTSGSTRGTEQQDLPRAGMQADSAVRAGYAQFMVAIDNGRHKSNDPNPSSRGGVMQLGNGQGLALVKAVRNQAGQLEYHVVDATAPLGRGGAEHTAFAQKLTAAGQSTAYAQAGSYSLVRRDGVLGSPDYKSAEWLVAETENDGVKSLGSRSYVAGLSPYKNAYTAYNSTNNPKRNPFWGNRTAPNAPAKQWGDLPQTGSNYRPDARGMDPLIGLATVASGSATRQDTNDVFAKSYDGDPNTRFWGGGPMPVTLTYNFDKPSRLEYAVYHAWDQRQSIDEYDIQVTYADGSTKRQAMPALGAPSRTAVRIDLTAFGDKHAKTVEFIVKSVGGRGDNAVSFYEMEFFKRNDNYQDPPAIFTDGSCSELRQGVTYQQVMAVENPFYREIARKILQGTYEREFRIEDYKAWTNPHYQRGINKNQFSYSLLDNPTGMYFAGGEEVVVLVGDTHGQELTLKVYDPEVGRNGILGGDNYTLRPGFNKFTMRRPGLGYILYHVDAINVDVNTHPNVRIHFPEGTGFVNGYYDTEKSSLRDRWTELLGKARAKHFDVLGKYAHLVFNTGAFRANTPVGKDLIANYDKLVFGEMMLMGVAKNRERTFRNRMLFMRMYDGFMNAFTHRTGYNFGSDNSDVARSLTHVPTQSQWTWGAAHEVGHMNQTLGLNWGGMIEITNNIHSFYIEHIIFKDSSRSLRSDRSGGNFYDPAWNALLETDRTLTSESTLTNSLVPFIQLQMYLGDVLGDTPDQKTTTYDGFYPRLYEALRDADYRGKSDNGNAEHNGYQQTEFTYHASVASGYDLRPFFERWGFYRTANNVAHRNTYNVEYRITVTDAMVNDVKARIGARALRPIPHGVAFEYITPRNKALFRNPQPVVKGTYTKSDRTHTDSNGKITQIDRTFTLTGWRNVVAWEVRDANNRLLHTTTGGVADPPGPYTVTCAAWQDGYVLNAIDAFGAKTRVN